MKTLFRRFPGIASSMQIVWFHPWGEQALRSVALRYLKNTPFAADDVKESIADHCAYVHHYVDNMCGAILKQQRYSVHVTPKSYLTFVAYFVSLLKTQRDKWSDKKQRLVVGLQRLQECGAQVATLQVKLKEVQTEAKERARSTSMLLDRVSGDRAIVEEQNAVARLEEAKTNGIVGEVNALVAECERDLKAAEPMVIAAREALNTLDKSNLTELKSMGSPPDDVREVTACVMCLLAVSGRIPHDRSWAAARRMMADVSRWMKVLLEYDVNNIPQVCVDAVSSTVSNPSFTPENMRSKSFAASSLCAWVINVVKYHGVRVQVRPKEERLEEARKRLAVSKNQLRKVQEKVAGLQSKLDSLIAEYNAAAAAKEAVEDLMRKTEQKLQRAQRLVVSLSGEKTRWAEGITELDVSQRYVVGDTMHAAAFVSYLGPFPSFLPRPRNGRLAGGPRGTWCGVYQVA